MSTTEPVGVLPPDDGPSGMVGSVGDGPSGAAESDRGDPAGAAESEQAECEQTESERAGFERAGFERGELERAEADQAELLRRGMESLRQYDRVLADLLDAEVSAQRFTLAMVASASLAAPSVLAAAGSVLSNVTAEGYPGARYHSGTARFDRIETLATERANLLFRSRYANVQPHSCSQANLAVFAALVRPGGTLLGLHLDAGGHLTHGSQASVTGTHYRAFHYGLDAGGRIDYARAAELAAEHRPDVVVAGASAYPRVVDFARFREIADSVGAYLVADVSHIAGLVATGRHPSPIDVAHVTTTSTYKQLGGPRGGLILSGVEHRSPGPGGSPGRRGGESLERLLQRAVFPRSQGTPNPALIAAKARAFALAARPEFAQTMGRVVQDAAAIADELSGLGYRLLTGGTDNHMVLIDLRERGMTGVVAERALEECGILVNRNRVPGDDKPPLIASGLRLGTNVLAQRGIGPDEARECARMVHAVLAATKPLDDTDYRIDPLTAARVRAEVRAMCERHPIPEETCQSIRGGESPDGTQSVEAGRSAEARRSVAGGPSVEGVR